MKLDEQKRKQMIAAPDGRATIEQEEGQQSSPNGQQSRTAKEGREDRTDKREDNSQFNNQPTRIIFILGPFPFSMFDTKSIYGPRILFETGTTIPQ